MTLCEKCGLLNNKTLKCKICKSKICYGCRINDYDVCNEDCLQALLDDSTLTVKKLNDKLKNY